MIFPEKSLRDWQMLHHALYAPEPLEGILKLALGDATLAEGVTECSSLLVTSFELDRSAPIVILVNCCVQRRGWRARSCVVMHLPAHCGTVRAPTWLMSMLSTVSAWAGGSVGSPVMRVQAQLFGY